MSETAAGRGGESKTRAIANELHRKIQSGEYPPGSRLPGENQIREQYGVARNTARDALAILAERGLIETRKGAGTYVRDFRPLVRDGIKRLSSQIWGSGRSIWADETEGRNSVHVAAVWQDNEPSDRVRNALQLPPGASVIVRSRQHKVDGRVVMLSRSALPSSLVAGTAIAEEDTGPGGSYARLRDLGHGPAHFIEDIRSRMPLPDETEQLRLVTGTPVFEIVRIAFDRDAMPVEVNEMVADATAYIFRYEFGA